MNQVNPLYGLVVCGGQSSRMGADKSLLDYHGQPQRYYLYDMLGKICDKVFISCNEQQANEIPGKYQVIVDDIKYGDTGPMGGLLSAFSKKPDTSFLVVGCDYPLIKGKDLAKLMAAMTDEDFAISYFNPEPQIREPLLAIYSEKSAELLADQFKTGNYSLNHFLKSVHAKTVIPDNPQILKSIDTPEAYRQMVESLKKS